MKQFIWNKNSKLNPNFKLCVGSKQIKRIQLLRSCQLYFTHKLYQSIPQDFLNSYNIISKQDPDFIKCSTAFDKKNPLKELQLNDKESRSIGSLVGLAIGDALGSTTQFQDYVKERKQPFFVKGFKDIQIKLGKEVFDRFGQTRVWTDDCSMALVMADSLLLNKFQFNPIHMRYLYTLWLKHGLDNGQRQASIGLGGNISISMNQFMDKQCQFTDKGNQNNNGNGSLMRLAPIPIAFRNSKETAMKNAELQSYTTHNGTEAAQCCRVLAGLLVTLINRKNQNAWKEEMTMFLQKFTTKCKSVQFLAKSQMQSPQHFQHLKSQLKGKQLQIFLYRNNSHLDRNWNWKDKNFEYSQRRVKQNSGYIGSYCMDGFSMALHIVWHKKSFRQCAVFAANMGGDCDTVGAIVCQIAGAIYGFNMDVLGLYSEMKDFTKKRYLVFSKAFKLAKGKERKIIFDSS